MHIARNGLILCCGILFAAGGPLFAQADLELQAHGRPFPTGVEIAIFNRGPMAVGPVFYGFTNAFAVPPATLSDGARTLFFPQILPGQWLTNFINLSVISPGYIGVEIFGSPLPDPDSIPVNLNPWEDDYAQAWVGGLSLATAELALHQTVSPTNVAVGGQAVFELTLANLAFLSASNMSVLVVWPPGLVLAGFSAPAGSSFDSSSGLWTIASLTISQSVSLMLTGTVQTAGFHTNTATLTASSPPDITGINNFSQVWVTATNASADLPPLLSIAGGPPPAPVILFWDVSAGNFQVLSATNLTPPVNWQIFPVPVHTVGDLRQAGLVATNPPSRFFKLVSTPYVLPPPVIQVSQHDDYLSLQWEPTPGALAYNVRVYDQPPVPGATPIYSLINLTNTIVNVENLPLGQTFYFTVSSVNAAGDGYESLTSAGSTGPFSVVYGQVSAELVRDNLPVMVHLPGITVYASNVVSGVLTEATVSAMDGEYSLDDIGAGTWKICWNGPGIVPGSTTTNLVLTNNSIRIPIQVVLATNASSDVVVASVRFADGTVPIIFEPFWGVDVRPQITLRNAQGALVASGQAADDGYVVLLPPVPKTGASYTLRVAVEAASVDVALSGVPSGVVNVVVPNQAPGFTSAFASQSGKPLLRALPNSAVQLTTSTTDPDGDTLTFEWRVNPSLNPPAPLNSPTPDWMLPAGSGIYTAYVKARDGKGGYAFARVNVVADSEVLFYGTVLENNPDNPIPLNGATVSVNGISTNTDIIGSFAIRAPLAAFYTLHASYPGYVPARRLFTDQPQEQEIRLKKLSTNDVMIVSGQGATVTNSSGLTLEIAPDSVQYQSGGGYTGPMRFESAVFNPCDEFEVLPMPYVIDDPVLGQGRVEPLGLAYLSIKDPVTGEILHLSPAKPGTLRIPLRGRCATNITFPPTLRRAYLNSNGVTSVTTSTNAVTGTNQHYLAPYTSGNLSLDYQFRTLTKVKVTADRTLNFPFVARVLGSMGPPETQTVFDDANSGVFEASVGETIIVEVFSLKEAPGEYFHDVNAGGSATPGPLKTVIALSFLVAAPVTNVVVMSLTNFAPEITSTNLATISRPQHFLAQGYRNYFTVAGTNAALVTASNSLALATNYYAAIKAPPTFNQWKQLNGFSSTSNLLTAAAQYYNVSDLGFARSMVMTVRLGPDGKTNVAYYVTNYRSVEEAIAEKSPVATVAMDYAATSVGAKRFTKFYVYGPNGDLLPLANLDNASNGDKPVPNLCIVCHGGSFYKKEKDGDYNYPDGNLGASFLPFDLEAFTYSKERGIQREELAKLNQGVLYTQPPAAITNLILGWYGGVPGGTKTNFLQDYVPVTWSNSVVNASLYRDVFKPSCRGCHISRSDKGYYDSFGAFTGADSTLTLCTFVMPNSQRTFGIFWGSKTANVIKSNIVPDQVKIFKAVLGDCPAP